jgi:anti-sigma factor RsiW
MNCDEVREIIQLYMDNELASRDTLNVQKHIESCSACSHILETFLNQDRLLREQSRADQADSRVLREMIVDAIRGETSRPMRRLSTRALWSAQPVWSRVAAILVLAIAGGLLLGKAGLVPGIKENVYAAVALDHADHCSIDSKLPAVTDVEELNRLSRTFGKLDRTPDLSALGYRNVRGRTCKAHGAEFLHLVYYGSDQPPLSVFLRPHSAGLMGDGLSVVQEKEFQVTSVSKSGVDLFVVTSIDGRAAEIARTIAAKI